MIDKLPPKPTNLMIIVEDNILVGKDDTGIEWTIRWCGNGQYSHWTLSLKSNSEREWYLYEYPEDKEKQLKDQIREAEFKYRIFW